MWEIFSRNAPHENLGQIARLSYSRGCFAQGTIVREAQNLLARFSYLDNLPSLGRKSTTSESAARFSSLPMQAK